MGLAVHHEQRRCPLNLWCVLTFALRFYNDAGTVAIGGTAPNLVFRQKYVTAFTNYSGPGNWQRSTLSLNITAKTPVVAFSSAKFAGVESMIKTGAQTWTINFTAEGVNGDQSVTVYVFDESSQVPITGNVGVEMYDPAGSGVRFYNSSQKPLVMVANMTQATTVNQPGKTLAVWQSGMPWFYVEAAYPGILVPDGYFGDYYLNAARVSGSTFTGNRAIPFRDAGQFSPTPGPFDNSASPNGGWMIFDVTGL